MQFKEIQELLKFLNKSEISELKIEKDTFKLNIKTKHYHKGNSSEIPVQQVISATPPPPAPLVSTPSPTNESSSSTTAKNESEADNGNLVTIKAPMIGTLYRKPSPDKDVFVNVGDTIKPGDVLCIIEAMKLFNEIESEVSGKIVKIFAEDSTPVEFDQPLFLVEPA